MKSAYILRGLACVVLAGVALALGGCISAGTVAGMIVDAPNGGHPKPQSGLLGKISREFYSQRFSVPVGPPSVKLAVAVIEPRNYGFSSRITSPAESNQYVGEWQVRNAPDSAFKNFNPRKPFLQRLQAGLVRLPVCKPVGTIILLPGWGETKETLIGYALDFASHGYRVVLVDLRGQGESSGKFVTYGLIEQHDISQLISALETRGQIAGKLALVGLSDGATIALDTAADNPRVSAVVAVAPFISLSTAVREVGNDYAPLLSDLISDNKITEALGVADRRTGVDLAQANPSSHVANIKAPVLYIAGGSDNIAPASAVRKLASQTPQAHFIELPKYPHSGLYFSVATVGPLALAALGKELGISGDSSCLHAPPDAPKDARYRLTFKLKYKLGNVSANPTPRKITN